MPLTPDEMREKARKWNFIEGGFREAWNALADLADWMEILRKDSHVAAASRQALRKEVETLRGDHETLKCNYETLLIAHNSLQEKYRETVAEVLRLGGAEGSMKGVS